MQDKKTNKEENINEKTNKKEDINEKIDKINKEENIIEEVNKINKEENITVENDKNEENDNQKQEDYKIKYLESLALMENMRKRLEIEKKEFIKYRASSFIQNILPNLDMFKMALNSKNVSEEIKNWLIGFEMILRNFEQILETEGVNEIKVNIGDDFDANIHNAIEEKETKDFESGKIIEIKNTGYKLHKRLLRPTTVVVSKKVEEEKK